MRTWDDKFIIGVEAIDEEHKSIIEKFDVLYEKMRVGEGHDYYNEFLDFLNDYVETHLKHEEDFQHEIHYPNVEEHIKLHDDFRTRINEMVKRSEVQAVSNHDLIEINLFVKNWLINHIMTIDQALGDFNRRLNGEF